MLIQIQTTMEKKITKQTIKNSYLAHFDNLNILKADLTQETDILTKLNEFIDYLELAYIEGFVGASYMIGADVTLDNVNVAEALNKKYDGISIFDKFTEYVNNQDYESANRLIESEYHRVYNQGSYDCASKSGKNLIKIWATVGDEKVRDTHYYLEGTSSPIDGYFYTFDGDKALYPSGFEKAENNANCRCWLEYITE